MSEDVSSLGLWKSGDKFNHSEGESLRSELSSFCMFYREMRNWECGVNPQSAFGVTRSRIPIRNSRFEFSLFLQITSAKLRSVRRKCQIPPTISTATTAMDRAKPGQYIACSPPRIDQRKPSMMPTIGLSE